MRGIVVPESGPCRRVLGNILWRGGRSALCQCAASGLRFELRGRVGIDESALAGRERVACTCAHVGISLGSEAAVDALSARLVAEGLLVAAPRHTGDGFYEAVVQDPEGNFVEITS